MDEEFKKLLAGAAWAETGNRTDPTSPVTRSTGWPESYSVSDAPSRTVVNQILRELYGAAKEVGLGVSQYDAEVSYPRGAICQVNGRLFYATQANAPPSPVSPTALPNTTWTEMGGIGEVPTAPSEIPVGDIFIDDSLANRIVVYWQEPPNGNSPVTQVDLRYSTSSSFPSASTTTITDYQAGSTISFSNRDSDRYYVSLRFRNLIGIGAWSTGKKVRSSALSPDAITSLRATGGIGAGLVDLDWSPPFARGLSINDYLIQWKSGAQSYDSTRQATSTTTSRRINGLVDDTTYTFQVIARSNRSTNSAASNQPTATPEKTPDVPDAPTIAAEAIDQGSVRGYVSALPDNNGETITTWLWQLKRTGDSWDTDDAVTTKTTTSTIVEFDSLTAGQTYHMRCRAYNGVGDSDSNPLTGLDGYGNLSNVVNVPTLSFGTPELPEIWARRSTNGDLYYGLADNVNETGGADVTRYQVRYKKTADSDYTEVSESSSSAGYITGTDPSSTYEVSIRVAPTSDLWSQWSIDYSLPVASVRASAPSITVHVFTPSSGGALRNVVCGVNALEDGGQPINNFNFERYRWETDRWVRRAFRYTTEGFFLDELVRSSPSRRYRYRCRVHTNHGDTTQDAPPQENPDGWSHWSPYVEVTF